jgi:hypothetical protein
MYRYAALAALAILTLVPFGVSSPTDGTYGKKSEVGSQPWRMTRTFQGGERAAVVALGDRAEDEIIGAIQIKVFDAKGTLVVEDTGASKTAGDFAGVAWYPPRTAEYRIEVHSARPNEVYIAIK